MRYFALYIHFSCASAAEIGFMETEYSVSETDPEVEVCVGITNGQSLDHGYGSATVSIVITSVNATGKLQKQLSVVTKASANGT